MWVSLPPSLPTRPRHIFSNPPQHWRHQVRQIQNFSLRPSTLANFLQLKKIVKSPTWLLISIKKSRNSGKTCYLFSELRIVPRHAFKEAPNSKKRGTTWRPSLLALDRLENRLCHWPLRQKISYLLMRRIHTRILRKWRDHYEWKRSKIFPLHTTSTLSAPVLSILTSNVYLHIRR